MRRQDGFGEEYSIYIIASVAMFIYVFLIFLSTIWILHKSPMSAIQEVGITEANLSILQDIGAPYGFTYANPNVPFVEQINPGLIGILIFFSGMFALSFFIITSLDKLVDIDVDWLGSLFLGIVAGLLYLLALVLALVFPPKLDYVTLDGTRISVQAGLWNASITFFVLVLLQAAVVAAIAAVWTRPILPEQALWNLTAFQNPTGLEAHLDNWSQYNRWIITLFGGTLVTISVIYILRVRGSNATFLLHAAILLGGGLAIILLFIMNKMIRIERTLTKTQR